MKRKVIIISYIENQDNIDNWTFEELQEIVQEFKAKVDNPVPVLTVQEEQKEPTPNDLNVISLQNNRISDLKSTKRFSQL